MKRLFLIMALTAFAAALIAQEPLPRPKAVERAYRADYRQALKSEQAVIERLEEEGWGD